MKIIKEFKGHSNGTVFLVEEYGKFFIHKTMSQPGEFYATISEHLPFPTPRIFEVKGNTVSMEYIPGIDLKQYLTYATGLEIQNLISFLSDYISYALEQSQLFDFTKEIENKNSTLKGFVDIDDHIRNMPKVLPKGPIHGDLTLENIIFYNGQFYFIDMHHTELNSIYFDANKLRQDLNGFWFIREETDRMNYVSSCDLVYNSLLKKFNNLFNDDIYAFMLARILPYCKRDLERNLVLTEINKCKS